MVVGSYSDYAQHHENYHLKLIKIDEKIKCVYKVNKEENKNVSKGFILLSFLASFNTKKIYKNDIREKDVKHKSDLQ